MTVRTMGLVFSKDRALQLDATLTSLAVHCADADSIDIRVLWKASDNLQLALYHELVAAHPTVSFTRETDFRADVQLLVRDAEFVMFVVDDTLFVRDFTIGEVVDALRSDSGALAYSLRLGRNTTYCYTMDRPQPLPVFSIPRPNALTWQWASAQDDFGYPLELSSSVYRVPDIAGLVARLRYRNPNTFEAAMAATARRFRDSHPRLISYETSVAFCAPLNLVQSVTPNRVGANPQHSAAALANMFDRGRRIDVNAYSGMVPIACHQEIELNLLPAAERPTVSVIIPCFEQGKYLGEAVESIVAQTFDDWEIVIVDDGSSDDTVEVALALMREHPGLRIRLERQPNGGPASARNGGIRSSSGRYVLPLDADDRIDPAMLERAVSMLDLRSDVAIAYTDVLQFGEASGIGRTADFDPELLPATNQFSYCSLYRRGVWHAAGGYDAGLPRGGYEDWDFWIAAVEEGFGAVRIPEPLFHYRVGSGNMYARAVERDRELRAIIVRNHPAAYTPWRRSRRFVKRVLRALAWRISAALRSVRERRSADGA